MKFRKKLELLRNLRRTERACWFMICVCLFLLFTWGIDLEYRHMLNNITVNVLHTITVVVFITVSVFQAITIQRTHEVEREVFNNEYR